MRNWLRKQEAEIARFMGSKDVGVVLPKQFAYAFLAFPMMFIAGQFNGPLALILWAVSFAYLFVAIALPFWAMVRSGAHRNARLYDSQGKHVLPPEYKNTESALKSGKRRG